MCVCVCVCVREREREREREGEREREREREREQRLQKWEEQSSLVPGHNTLVCDGWFGPQSLGSHTDKMKKTYTRTFWDIRQVKNKTV